MHARSERDGEIHHVPDRNREGTVPTFSPKRNLAGIESGTRKITLNYSRVPGLLSLLKKKKNPPKAFILETQNLSPSRLLSPAQYWSCNYRLEGQNGPFNVWSWDVIKSKCWQQVSPTFTKRFHAKMHVRAGLGKHKKKKKNREKKSITLAFSFLNAF